MVGAIGHGTGSIGQLPGDEDAPLSAEAHAVHSVIESGNEPAHTLGEYQRFGIAHLRLTVRIHFGLTVLIANGLLVIFPVVEDYAVCRAPALVLDTPQLARLAYSAGANLDVLIFQRERGLGDSGNTLLAGGQLVTSSGGR